MSPQPQIDYDALAQQAGAISSAPAPQGDVDYDALAQQAGAIDSTPPPPQGWFDRANADVTPQSGDSTIMQIGRGMGRLAMSVPNLLHTVMLPPQTPEESAVHAGGGQAALALKRILYDPSANAYQTIDDTANSTRGKIQAAQSSGILTPDQASHALDRLDDYVLAGKALASIPVIGAWAFQEGKLVEDKQLGTAGALTDVLAPAALAYIPEIARVPGAVGRAVTGSTEVAGAQMATRPIFTASTAGGTEAVQNVASAVGAEGVEPAASLRDIFQPAQEAAKETSKGFYAVADDATEGKLQPALDKIGSIGKVIRRGVDPETFDKLTAQKAALQGQVQDLIDSAQTETTKIPIAEGAEPLESEAPFRMNEAKAPNGLDIGENLTQAKAWWGHQSALDDLNDLFSKKSNVTGPRPGQVLPGVSGVPKETINFRNLAADMNAFDPDRLQQALTPPGTEPAAGALRAQQLTTAVNLAAKEGWAPGIFHKVIGVVFGAKAAAIGRAAFM